MVRWLVFRLAPSHTSIDSAEAVASLSPTSQLLLMSRTSSPRLSAACGFGPSRSGPGPLQFWATAGSPGYRAWSFHTCSGSSTAQSQCPARACAAHRIAFRTYQLSRRSEMPYFAAPCPGLCVTPVNDAGTPLRMHPHESEPSWLARPSSSGACTLDSMPVYPGALIPQSR